ncbi:gas vesicle protein K [Dactylosporangium salmoneum]|uniref:Gas vesicle protein K n=1 Tax=Dactylosporangium salmoneum TaxID=53361 RepID=A0ABP5U113_9ACTN
MTAPREEPTPIRPPGHRIEVDREAAERGFASLVLTVVELLRQLMERQALRRIDAGGLSDEQIEEIGVTLMALEERMTELREHFGLSAEDLNLDLGPLGTLLPDNRPPHQ